MQTTATVTEEATTSEVGEDSGSGVAVGSGVNVATGEGEGLGLVIFSTEKETVEVLLIEVKLTRDLRR